MKNTQKFAAQQLTKKQMNDVRGGAVYHYVNCMIVDIMTGETLEWSHAVMGSTFEEALNNIYADMKDGQAAKDCRHDYIYT